MKTKYNEHELREAIKTSFSISETNRKLGIRPNSNYSTIYKYIKLFNIDISHFTGQAWNKGFRVRPFKSITLEEILIENSTYASSSKLKNRLFKEKVKEEKCECCGNSEWMGLKIPLELHHINGDNTDNRIENLQILCPNCHSQTDNNSGKNRGKNYRVDKNIMEYNNLKNSKKIKEKKKVEPKVYNTCKFCGCDILTKRKEFCSKECYSNYRYKKNGRPDKEELIESFLKYKNFLQVGKFYGVSDNAVRKWCKKYNMFNLNKNDRLV